MNLTHKPLRIDWAVLFLPASPTALTTLRFAKLNRPRYHPRPPPEHPSRSSSMVPRGSHGPQGSIQPLPARGPSTLQAGPQLSGLLTTLSLHPITHRSRSAPRLFLLKTESGTLGSDHRCRCRCRRRRKGEHPLLFLVHLILAERRRNKPSAEATDGNQPLCSVSCLHTLATE